MPSRTDLGKSVLLFNADSGAADTGLPNHRNPDARHTLGHRAVEPAVDDPERLVVIGCDVDLSDNAVASRFHEPQTQRGVGPVSNRSVSVFSSYPRANRHRQIQRQTPRSPYPWGLPFRIGGLCSPRDTRAIRVISNVG